MCVCVQAKEHVATIEGHTHDIESLEREVLSLQALNSDLRGQLKTQANLTAMQAQLDSMQASVEAQFSPRSDEVQGRPEQPVPTVRKDDTLAEALSLNVNPIAGTPSPHRVNDSDQLAPVSPVSTPPPRSMKSSIAHDVEVDALAAIARARALTPARRAR